MSPEKTLNDPLSGSEIKEIIAQEIRKRMDGDCTLLDDHSYAGFIAKFDIKISYLRSQVKETLVWGQMTEIKVADGEHNGITAEFTDEKVIADTYTSASSPDVERQEHDLPIPVLVQMPAGAQRQKVRIEKVRR